MHTNSLDESNLALHPALVDPLPSIDWRIRKVRVVTVRQRWYESNVVEHRKSLVHTDDRSAAVLAVVVDAAVVVAAVAVAFVAVDDKSSDVEYMHWQPLELKQVDAFVDLLNAFVQNVVAVDVAAVDVAAVDVAAVDVAAVGVAAAVLNLHN